VVKLPLHLPFRDFNQLILLADGVVKNKSSRFWRLHRQRQPRAFSNDYLLDGVPNNDIYQGRSAIPVSIDVIREFPVTHGVANAEFG